MFTVWAHPRSRGENSIMPAGMAVVRGSSPLTRGKPLSRLLALWRHGLIPAHAGKTESARSLRIRRGAHPRSRGENPPGGDEGQSIGGSSPLTRGKLADQALTLDGLGLIPAHAGKTRGKCARSPGRWAHPRSRGENQTVYKQLSQWSGSSPLTRGKRTGRRRGRSQQRLIPAHAGKT